MMDNCFLKHLTKQELSVYFDALRNISELTQKAMKLEEMKNNNKIDESNESNEPNESNKLQNSNSNPNPMKHHRQGSLSNPHINKALPRPNVPPSHASPKIMPLSLDQAKVLLLSEDFWEEFRQRSKIDSIVSGNDTKIRTKPAMTLISNLRRVPLRHINYLDLGVKFLTGRTKNSLENSLQYCSLVILGNLFGIPESEIPEVYKGIIIDGLPQTVTAMDETVRALDTAVLSNDFIVSYIEIVENVLRITFKKDISQNDIDTIRRNLKKFLKEDMKLDKKHLKKVFLIPHTRDTWGAETTTDEDDPTPYGNEVQ